MIHPRIDRPSCTGAAKQLAEVKGELEIRDVNFSYPQRPKVKVLRGFSLQAHAGQTVALVGASGNGKSTIVGLIERWYDVTSGQVTCNRKEVGFALAHVFGMVVLASQQLQWRSGNSARALRNHRIVGVKALAGCMH